VFGFKTRRRAGRRSPNWRPDAFVRNAGHLRGADDERNSKETLGGRGRPGPYGIRAAHGLDCVGFGCFDADDWDNNQQRIFKRRSKSVPQLVDRASGAAALVYRHRDKFYELQDLTFHDMSYNI
jgi:hypothetical protein